MRLLQAKARACSMPAPRRAERRPICSSAILRRENDAQVQAFLARTPDARLQPLDARFGQDTGHGSQRLPGEDGMDGFFYARLVKA